MHDLARMRKLDVWYARLDIAEMRNVLSTQLTSGQAKRFEQNVAKAQAKDSMKAFNKLVHMVDGHPRLVSDPP